MRLADIGSRRISQPHGARYVGPRLKDVLPLVKKVIRLNVQCVPESEFHAEIRFPGDLPRDVGIRIAVYGDSGTRIGQIRSERVPAGLHVDVRQIEKPVFEISDLVVSDKSVSRFQFQFGQHLFHRLHEFLVGNHPAETDRREKSEPMALCESFGAVITEIALDEIAGIVTVSKPPGQRNIPVRQRLVQRPHLRGGGIPDRTDQHRRNIVFLRDRLGVIGAKFPVQGRSHVFVSAVKIEVFGSVVGIERLQPVFVVGQPGDGCVIKRHEPSLQIIVRIPFPIENSR